MPKNPQNYKISLSELPRKTIFNVSYLVRIPNFFYLLENDVTEVEISSPSFEFAEASWQFIFKSKGKYNGTDKFIRKIKVFLEKLNSELRVISYSILLLDADNEKRAHRYGNCKYDECMNKWNIGTFRSSNPYYDRHDTLTLIIHLISDELPDTNVVQASPSSGSGLVETAKDCRVSLSELPRKTLSSVNYLIKMPNFFTQPEYTDNVHTIYSQRFEFCRAFWKFVVIPRKTNELCANTDELTWEFALYLVRLKSEIQKHLMSFTIVSVNGDGEEYITDQKVFLFEESHKNVRMSVLCRRVTFYHGLNALTRIVRLICEESPDESVDKKLLEKENGDNDLTLRVPEKVFQVHKDVLMARSPVFLSMLSHDMTEKRNGFIDIPDCDHQTMEQFLIYMYCGNVETLNENNVFGLYYIADKYGTDLLKKQCSDFIKKSLSPSNIRDVINLSRMHSDTDLLDYATKYFLNLPHIFHTSERESFSEKHIITAYGWDQLYQLFS